MILLSKTGFRLNGKALKLLRMANDLSGIEVAEALGVSNKYISMCESKKRILSEKLTAKFLELIKADEEEVKEFCRIIKLSENGGRN